MTLSTHVLDAAAGRPAEGVGIRLERRDGTAWTPLTEGRTDGDGRLRDLPATDKGTYRLVFDTAAHSDFFPEVSVVFTITEPDRHHHVPLLLSPFAYSTYRGS
jgi:5-hydroxyisourate hydrolase